MKAIIYEKYGPPQVLTLAEVRKPSPKENEILIKIHTTSVTAADCYMRKSENVISRLVLGIRKPRKKILGTELAGTIESVGKNVKHFKTGDRVFGFTGFSLGAYAEYVCLPENASIIKMSPEMSFEEAVAIVDGATTALFFLKNKANIQAGQRVLINGASGSMGTAAVQIAKLFGAHVTGVCSSANLELVKSLSADKVIDYTKEDFTLMKESYDIIFDTVSKSTFSKCKSALKPDGVYLVTKGGLRQYLLTLWTSLFGNKKIIYTLSIEKTESLSYIKEIFDQGNFQAIIDQTYSLENIIAAHNYVEKGHKKGNIVITIAQ